MWELQQNNGMQTILKKNVRRESLAIASEILYYSLAGAHKTSIVSSCNLSTKVCKKYVTLLLRKGLLERKEDNFNTTEKGKQFLAAFQKLELIWGTP